MTSSDQAVGVRARLARSLRRQGADPNVETHLTDATEAPTRGAAKAPTRGAAKAPTAGADAAPAPPPQLRQGDVLLVPVRAVPAAATVQPRTGRLILALGEATGHAHAIEEKSAREFVYDDQRYLLTKSVAQLLHEEHAAIEVPPGAYRIVIQREYEPAPDASQAWRRVAD